MFNKQYAALAIDKTVPNFACFHKKLLQFMTTLPVEVIR